jgi:hypothetical protein
MPDQKNSDEKPPLSDYRPVQPGWRRINELDDEQSELAGKLLLIATIVVIVIMLFTFRR